MKPWIASLLLLCAPALALAQNGGTVPADQGAAYARGILESVENATVKEAGETLLLAARDTRSPIELVFAKCNALGIEEDRQWWVLPLSAAGKQIDANRGLWVLPVDPTSKDPSWHVKLNGGSLRAASSGDSLHVTVRSASVTLTRAEGRPHSDAFGHRFSFQMTGGTQLENALAAFYWGTMLPSVVERTMAAKFPYHDGYVLSTLNVSSYAGSYPAVDHEFQIRGRLAMGSELDLDVVRRMIELQFRLMHDDPERLYRAPTSVQPDGRREYHVRRDSQDHRQNAAMFPVTGNIEVIEEAWGYYEATNDTPWLKSNIANLEHAAGWVLANTDQYGRVWSDVYYEDQVIKDGRVTQAQAFAAHAFTLLAAMETRSGGKNSGRYAGWAKKMAAALVAPLPEGYWDAKKERFIDWVDRNGEAHDHMHLLANELPVLFGYATADQRSAVRRFVADHAAEFERFPSFLAADIAGYSKSEIGTGGPYDLCAAGRYWYWDAAFRNAEKENGVLFDQLRAVAAEGAKNGYFMDERYDMDHVYYVDGKDAHGAEKYYEYPNVFAAVLIDKFLGLSFAGNSDVSVAPHLAGYGSVEFAIPRYAVRYSYSRDEFVLRNLSSRARRFTVDLSALGFAGTRFRLSGASGSRMVGAHSTVTLAGGEEAHWSPVGKMASPSAP